MELEIKAQLEKGILEAFQAKLKTSGYDSKAEWLREQIRIFLSE